MGESINKKNRYEKHPVATIMFVIILSTILFLAVIEKFLSAKGDQDLFEDHAEGVTRYIRLKENPPPLNDVKWFNFFETNHKKYKFRVDGNGFVVPSKIHSSPDINIFFLGGSTTLCADVQEENRFPYLSGRLLEKKLGKSINSFNSGVSGNNSMHSIDILINKIIPMNPTVVVMMHNSNDAAVLWREGSYWNQNHMEGHPEGRSLIVQPSLKTTYDKIKELIIENTIPNVFERIELSIKKLMGILNPDKASALLSASNIERKMGKEESIAQFRQNLETFISICRIRGVVPVLMTQANRFIVNPDEYIKKLIADFRIDYDTFKDVYDAFTEVIREVGKKSGVLVIDLAKEIPQNEKYILDWAHLNDTGSKLSAEIIARELSDHLASVQKNFVSCKPPPILGQYFDCNNK